jgi:hypothetical protein
MVLTGGLIYLDSGKWRWRVESSHHQEFLDLIEPGKPVNKMRVPLPFSWRMLEQEELREIARRPEMRLWMDRDGVLWRVAAVGPGTSYDYPLATRHLIFDSQQSWAGIVEFREPAELGDLTDDELHLLRDHISDFGGRRKRFRRAV